MKPKDLLHLFCRGLVLLAVLLLGVLAASPATGDDLDDFIVAKMNEARVPGLSAAVIHNDQILWSNAYGLAKIEDPEQPATMDTIYSAGSISKTVTATALLQLWEQGHFELDDPINDYLPFEVIHPKFPNTPITFRMLLSHTSAIRSHWEMDVAIVCGDSPIPLGEFMTDCLDPGGQYYDPLISFWDWEPGEDFHYAEFGFSLIGYLVEIISGMSFGEYCYQNIFGPEALDLSETRWFLADLDLDQIAVQYVPARGHSYKPVCHHGSPAYPGRQLRTTAPQLLRFLGMLINGGQWNGVQILQPETVALMQSEHVETEPFFHGVSVHHYGFGMWLVDRDGYLLIGHGGFTEGGTAYMLLRPADNLGVVIMANGEPRPPGPDFVAWEAINSRLFREFNQLCAADLDGDGVVGMGDLKIWKRAVGPHPGHPADLDGDGLVTMKDARILVAAWGPCPYANVGPSDK